MSRPTGEDRTNTLQLLIVIVGFLLLAYYGMIALTSRDPLWFLGGFEGQPSRIVVYHAGQRAGGVHPTELLPGEAGFDELASAAQTSLDQGFARLTTLGLSQKSLQEAYTRCVTL